MGFQVHRFCLSWGLLLVMLTCFSEGHFFSEERFLSKSIKDMLWAIKEKPGNTYEIVNYSDHGKRAPRSSTTLTSTTTTRPTSASWNWEFPTREASTTTTTTEETGVEFRQIIDFPIRCPENHVYVGGRCRLRV